MSKLLTILLCITVSIVSAQDIKTYTGIYESGKASYQYYEDKNFERIYHGRFNYNSETYTVSGQYKNNLRNGAWKITQVIPQFDSKRKVVATVTANYSTGNLNGYCSYEEKDVQKNLIQSKATAIFRNNIMVSKMTFSFKSENYYTLSGCLHLTDEGYADSTLRIVYSKYGVKHEQLMQFKNGFLVSNLNRNLTTGYILNKSNRNKLVEDFSTYYNEDEKYALIPIVEVMNDADSPFLMRNENNGTRGEFNELKKDTLINAPISFENYPFVGDYNSFRPIYDALNFWNSVSNNPLYFSKMGVIIPVLKPIKTPVFEEGIFNKICAKKVEQRNRQERANLLDSLRKNALQRTLFTSAIIDTTNKVTSAIISKLPVSMFLHRFYSTYTNYNNSDKDYYTNIERVKRNNATITIFISEIEKEANLQNHYISRIADYRIKVEDMAKWLGCRTATIEEVKVALSKKEISLPQEITNSDLFYWLIKL